MGGRPSMSQWTWYNCNPPLCTSTHSHTHSPTPTHTHLFPSMAQKWVSGELDYASTCQGQQARTSLDSSCSSEHRSENRKHVLSKLVTQSIVKAIQLRGLHSAALYVGAFIFSCLDYESSTLAHNAGCVWGGVCVCVCVLDSCGRFISIRPSLSQQPTRL